MNGLLTLLNLVVNFLQHPIETIVIVAVCCMIVYAVEQKYRP
jgi:hypothetical protein